MGAGGVPNRTIERELMVNVETYPQVELNRTLDMIYMLTDKKFKVDGLIQMEMS